MKTAPQCRICGCTQLKACVTEKGPCHWASPDLCSACVDFLPALDTANEVLVDILMERAQQIRKHGYDADHDDDNHLGGELARAAIAYAVHASVALSLGQKWGAQKAEAYAGHKAPGTWPWEAEAWKPKSPREDLLRAAALLVAEIEKIDRAEARAKAEVSA